jgi:hypothetical protein
MRWQCQFLDFDGRFARNNFPEARQMTKELLLGLLHLRLLPVSDKYYYVLKFLHLPSGT